MMNLGVAALQMPWIPGSPAETWGRFESLVRRVGEQFPQTDLILAPEQYLSAPPPGLDERADYMLETAVEIPGPIVDRLAKLARSTRMWLVPGSLYERVDGGVHNTVVVISPDGELVARYRKVFPWQPYETCLPGDRFVCFDIAGIGRLGLAVCYDGYFPEVARQLAWMGAKVILQPSLTWTIDRRAELVLAQASAIANQLFLVNVNAPAPAGVGRSLIVDPEGLVRCEAGATEEILTDVIDFDAVSRVRSLGTHGLNRVWDQLDRYGAEIELPAYGGSFRPRRAEPVAAPASANAREKIRERPREVRTRHPA